MSRAQMPPDPVPEGCQDPAPAAEGLAAGTTGPHSSVLSEICEMGTCLCRRNSSSVNKQGYTLSAPRGENNEGFRRPVWGAATARRRGFSARCGAQPPAQATAPEPQRRERRLTEALELLVAHCQPSRARASGVKARSRWQEPVESGFCLSHTSRSALTPGEQGVGPWRQRSVSLEPTDRPSEGQGQGTSVRAAAHTGWRLGAQPKRVTRGTRPASSVAAALGTGGVQA